MDVRQGLEKLVVWPDASNIFERNVGPNHDE